MDEQEPLGWKMRAAVVISLAWVVGAWLVAVNENNDGGTWSTLVSYCAPLGLLWGIGWVIAGVPKKP